VLFKYHGTQVVKSPQTVVQIRRQFTQRCRSPRPQRLAVELWKTMAAVKLVRNVLQLLISIICNYRKRRLSLVDGVGKGTMEMGWECFKLLSRSRNWCLCFMPFLIFFFALSFVLLDDIYCPRSNDLDRFKYSHMREHLTTAMSEPY
jgi:hypothetical protein